MSQEIGKVVAVFGATGGLGREVVYQVCYNNNIIFFYY